jgi:hypothetical protein
MYFPDGAPKTNQSLAQETPAGTTRNVRDNNRAERNTKIGTKRKR